jgi:hypothetical protein
VVNVHRQNAVIRRADGESELVPVDIPEGFFPTGEDQLQRYRMNGWQNTDTEHPSDRGHPGYRVAYKTLKLIPSRDIQLQFPNLRLTFGSGTLDRGGVRTPEGCDGRAPNHQIVPEYGMRLTEPSGTVRYVGCPDRRFTFAAWQEDLGGIFYVEILYRLAPDVESDPDSVRRAGRAAVAPIKTMLELAAGPRLLGIPLLEEIGQVFDDWHWNRRLDSVSLSTELQLRPQIVGAQAFAERMRRALDDNQSKTAEERRRFRLASQWYWLADAEPDPVSRFIYFWLVIESLEMQTTNIAPVKARLKSLLGSSADTGSFVGRLYRQRGALVHGNSDEVASEVVHQVEVTARSLLRIRMGERPSEEDVGLLKVWVHSDPH